MWRALALGLNDGEEPHFFDYLVEQRCVTGNPVKPSHMVRRGRPLPKALSQDQVQQLFAQIHHPMDKALFLLMLGLIPTFVS